MSTESQSDRRGHHPDGFAEFTEELRLLAEVLLARVEPVLRRTAADGQADLGGCSWCPVCAAAALVRGEHHDVVAALAEHGTSMVTVLREALAGVPVEPVLPPEWAEYAAAHHDSHGAYGYDDDRHGHTGTGWPTDDAARSGDGSGRPPADAAADAAAHARSHTGTTPTDHADGSPRRGAETRAAQAGAHRPGTETEAARAGFPRPGTATPTDEVPAATEHGSDAAASTDTAQPAGRTRLRWGSARSSQAPRPRRVDEFEAPRAEGTTDTTAGRRTAPDHDGDTRTGPATQPADTARDDRSRSTRAPRSRYVDIPVTIRG
ncbi:hypothetical protein [Nocardia asteroides]|uniref:hypothetical protein n=1 Tax=Nocardia asteroides TaxID=1824 RepID=UPI0033EF3605